MVLNSDNRTGLHVSVGGDLCRIDDTFNIQSSQRVLDF
jgi:hypothetical protein